ncbi:MAG TPA: hypothetical protein PKN09_08930 [Novosphingobium sp.]|nr:hypothetical protein [Novosphingobium sp.]
MIKFRTALVPALLLAAAPAAVHAAPPVTEATTEPMMSDGKQIGCTLSFVVTQDDTVNFGKNGRADVSGSLNFMMTDSKTPLYALKVGVGPENARKYTAPVNALLIDGTTPTTGSLIKRIDSDTSGYALFAFRVDDPVMSATIAGPAQNRELRFNYQLREGGKTVDAAVAFPGEKGREIVASWLQCLKTVVG